VKDEKPAYKFGLYPRNNFNRIHPIIRSITINFVRI